MRIYLLLCSLIAMVGLACSSSSPTGAGQPVIGEKIAAMSSDPDCYQRCLDSYYQCFATCSCPSCEPSCVCTQMRDSCIADCNGDTYTFQQCYCS